MSAIGGQWYEKNETNYYVFFGSRACGSGDQVKCYAQESEKTIYKGATNICQ